MEFVSYDDAMDLLGECGVIEAERSEERVRLALQDADHLVSLRLSPEDTDAGDDASRVLVVPKSRVPDLLEHVFHRMKVQQLFVLPVGRWRGVFDAVAFSMAEVEEWQEVDATSSVSLNTHDPLMCDPGDLHTLRALIEAIFSDAETPEQGITITTTNTPLMVQLHPDGNVQITVSSEALADEIEKALVS